jgi:hypothetical protein
MTLERDIDGIELPERLLGGDAAAGRDQRPEALFVVELPKSEAVYPLSAGRVGTVVWAASGRMSRGIGSGLPTLARVRTPSGRS